MTQLGQLLWKEWREARPYLLIGLGLFVGMPVVGCLMDYVQFHRHRLEFGASLWVVPLGGVLAVFVAVGVTTQDLRPKLEDFWRSRPIGVTRWVAAKYGVALAVVLVTCGLPLAIEWAVDRRADAPARQMLAFLPFYWAAAFSLAFLAGCVIGRAAHAATLGLAVLLLIFTVPIIVPPLAWLSLNDLLTGDDRWAPRLAFGGGMVGLTLASAAVAVVAVRLGWRVESGQRLLFGLIAAAFLLLFTSAAFQLGGNLPVLQQVDLPDGQSVEDFNLTGGDRGYLITWKWTEPADAMRPASWSRRRHWRVPFEVRPTGVFLGPPVEIGGEERTRLASSWRRAVATDGTLAYSVGWSEPTVVGGPATITLMTTDAGGRAVNQLKLWDEPATFRFLARPYLWQHRLYVVGSRVVVLDVSQPDRPRVVSDVANADQRVGNERQLFVGDQLQIPLLPLPGMPPPQRLEATIRCTMPGAPFDGHFFGDMRSSYSELVVGYRLAGIDDRAATFDKIGEYQPTLLQRLTGHGYVPPAMVDGLIFLTYGENGAFNSSVTLIDTRGPRPMRAVGHFAAPGAQFVYPLPDGRGLAGGGTHLWLVGPPRRER